MNPETRFALGDLVHRYAALVDDRRFDDAVQLFVDDATLSLPDPPRSLEPVVTHSGHTEIRRAMAAAAAVTRTQHAIVGETYTAATQDTAQGRISCIAHHWTDREGKLTDYAWHLRYDDEYLYTGDQWRFASRTVTIDAIETPPVRKLRPEA
ncbi:MAG TPA: nuclear transport factor 2 family protein [Mycobacterium sp.]